MSDEPLSSVFWGDGGRWVVVDDRTAYGPFFSPEVAHCWRGDMIERSGRMHGALLLELTPPPSPPPTVSRLVGENE